MSCKFWKGDYLLINDEEKMAELVRKCCASCKHKRMTRSTHTRLCALRNDKVDKNFYCDDWQPTTALAKLAKQFNKEEN